MSHLHLPDGTLPLWLWVGGLIAALGLVLLALRRLQAQRRRLPVVAVMAAVGLVAMNIPLGLPLHMNLAALAGIILGPLLGFLAVFVVNLFNALVAHGGLTMLGVNSLLVGSEALASGAIFLLLGGAKRLLVNAGVAVVAALLISSLLVVGVAGIAGAELETLIEHDHEHSVPADSSHGGRFLGTFIKLIVPLVAVWMVLEVALTLLVIGYVNKVKGGWFARG